MAERYKEYDFHRKNLGTALSMDAPMAHWLLRFALSATFLFHGANKATQIPTAAETFGLSTGTMSMVASVEFAVPAFLALGGLTSSQLGDVLTRLAGLLAIVILVGAISVVHWGQWSFAPSDTHPYGGMEFQVTLIAIALFFVFKGNKA
ncbi:DoxX family protein [Ruegeria aquimaris]|uniref:DoxX family protein n=1 Tax=Ruegeria aquimaris TaxID=2984333 RepID=A0ABT3AH83_9RHOB|nr:DoxX family protein [Ruegeria sp. XHP0148]MCV2888041.1 DoxX family protein [Ruegeria sp. XHP0148]